MSTNFLLNFILFFLGQALSGASLRHCLPGSANKLSLDPEAPSVYNRNYLCLVQQFLVELCLDLMLVMNLVARRRNGNISWRGLCTVSQGLIWNLLIIFRKDEGRRPYPQQRNRRLLQNQSPWEAKFNVHLHRDVLISKPHSLPIKAPTLT